jgi:hypothetical protein
MMVSHQQNTGYFMKLKSLLLAASVMISGSALAKTWLAVCKDGKNIQFNQSDSANGNGFLYMKVKDSNGRMNTYQVARLKRTFYNGVAICGTVLQNGTGNTGTPITQICANKSRGTIYVKYKHPYDASQPMKSGIYCSANVYIR